MSTLRVPVTDADHSTGDAESELVVVEYGDYQCPYCAEAFPVLQALLREFSGQFRLVFRNFPLAEAHDQAVNAAVVAEFAADNGSFWQAHDLLYEHQDRLGDELYAEICRELGLDVNALQQAFDEGRYLDRIEADERGGIRSGVNGTPTFFVNGERLDGGISDLELLLRSGGRY